MDKVSFSLTYSALKMFGKQLYSNVGSAISELVANGLDAKANNVFITIDMRDKEKSYVEIYDDGKGMDETDVKERYIVIGYNKRKHEEDMKDGNAMGRKGIGKLAALYLSNSFRIYSKKLENCATAWELDVSNLDDDDTPQLVEIDFRTEESVFGKALETEKHGTVVSLSNVDMSRLGDRAMESIEEKLSNFFLYDQMSQNIYIKIIKKDDDLEENYKKIEKHIAIKNMACICTTDTDTLSNLTQNEFSLPYKTKTDEEKEYTGVTNIIDLCSEEFSISGTQEFWGLKKDYCVKGWIGIHSSIDSDIAKKNDGNYIKNRFYNPNQIRLYVRNKLALANIIEHLGITRAFANYLEGEISFNILDDDDLPDIATAGRQDFDTQDPRFILLKDIVAKIGNYLVNRRQHLADEINKHKKNEDVKISSKSKTIFKGDIEKELESMTNLSDKDRNRITQFVITKLEGDVNLETKAEYTIFISHSSKDHIFSDFIYYYLKSCGFNGDLSSDSCEIFYSSSGLDTENLEPLSSLIKSYILHKNNDILFMPSKNFNESQFCLFEGGAAWATRAVGEYKILALNYEDIPTFLTNGKSEACLNIKTKHDVEMSQEKYNNIVKTLNRLIDHLNRNRIVAGKQIVPKLMEVAIPDKVQLALEGKTIFDYMDQNVLTYWRTYVENEIDKYFIKDE